MKVRDRTTKVAEYKGRWTDASDVMCPCRPCYNAHDCGYRAGSGKWVVKMECATRYNAGCAHDSDGNLVRPTHIIRSKNALKRKAGQIRKCLRCGETITFGDVLNFFTEETHKARTEEKTNA